METWSDRKQAAADVKIKQILRDIRERQDHVTELQGVASSLRCGVGKLIPAEVS